MEEKEDEKKPEPEQEATRKQLIDLVDHFGKAK